MPGCLEREPATAAYELNVCGWTTVVSMLVDDGSVQYSYRMLGAFAACRGVTLNVRY